MALPVNLSMSDFQMERVKGVGRSVDQSMVLQELAAPC